jgi:hypothetical protein
LKNTLALTQKSAEYDPSAPPGWWVVDFIGISPNSCYAGGVPVVRTTWSKRFIMVKASDIAAEIAEMDQLFNVKPARNLNESVELPQVQSSARTTELLISTLNELNTLIASASALREVVVSLAEEIKRGS